VKGKRGRQKRPLSEGILREEEGKSFFETLKKKPKKKKEEAEKSQRGALGSFTTVRS